MSPFQSRRPQEEERPESRGPKVDLDAKVCPACRMELPAWARSCPEDGAEPVRREDLPPPDDPLLARFLETDEDADAGDAGDGAEETDGAGPGDS